MEDILCEVVGRSGRERKTLSFLCCSDASEHTSVALQGLDRGSHFCVTVAVAELISETCHYHEEALKPIMPCRQHLRFQGDASQ
jgi:hypothetical protein